jgi:hypothetical protein
VTDRTYWVWSTHPTEQHVEALVSRHGWWTCHPDTKQGDLVLVYLTSPLREIAFLVEATSDAYLVPHSTGEAGPWDGDYACGFLTHVEFGSALTLSEMKKDRLLRGEFTAMRGNFQQRVYEVTPVVWDRLVGKLVKANPASEKAIRKAERHRVAPEVLLEAEIEDALQDNLDVLRPTWKLRLDDRQFPCSGLGFIDLLCHDRRGPVVIELKRGRATGDAATQTVAYMGWIDANLAKKTDTVRGLVISDGYDHRFRYALEAIPNLHHLELSTIRGPLGL